jgi:hypothetical protein
MAGTTRRRSRWARSLVRLQLVNGSPRGHELSLRLIQRAQAEGSLRANFVPCEPGVLGTTNALDLGRLHRSGRWVFQRPGRSPRYAGD